MPPSFFRRDDAGSSPPAPKVPPLAAALLRMPGVGEAMQQFAGMANGVLTALQQHGMALQKILQQQDIIMAQNREILNLLGYAAEPTAEVSAAAKIAETTDGE